MNAVETIVWDVDDVLNELTRSWLEAWWRPSHPDCRIRYEEVTENPPTSVLGISMEDYLASLDAFRQAAAADLVPRPEVLDWFERHGHRFRHVALTATPLAAAPISAAWVMRHFGRWIRTYGVVPSSRVDEPDLPEFDRDKGAYLGWLGRGDLLIDDHPRNIVAARRAGVAGRLVPQPWNKAGGTLAELLHGLAELVPGGAGS